MKNMRRSSWIVVFMFYAAAVAAQNGAYSSYYSYTVTPNSDGTVTVIATAEVTGIDDVSDWVEGSYRPVCTVRPKIQLTGDAAWVGGTRVALGHAVDQVRTGKAVYIPHGSTVDLQFSVEADANCSGAPSPIYYLYPIIANLKSWADIDPYIWSLVGFEPAQTNPPYWYQYCPYAEICPVVYGVASIRNFVDFADFYDIIIGGAYTKEIWIGGQLQGYCAVTSNCTNTTTPLCYSSGIYVGQNGACSPAWDSYFGTYKIGSGPTHCFSVHLSLPTGNTSPEWCDPAQ